MAFRAGDNARMLEQLAKVDKSAESEALMGAEPPASRRPPFHPATRRGTLESSHR